MHGCTTVRFVPASRILGEVKRVARRAYNCAEGGKLVICEIWDENWMLENVLVKFTRL